MYHFSIFQDTANRLIIYSQHSNPVPALSQHLYNYYHYIISYNYYYYLLPVYIISAGVLRLYKNANPWKTVLFYFIVPLPLSTIPPETVDTSALSTLHIYTLYYTSFPSHFFQFFTECWSAGQFNPIS